MMKSLIEEYSKEGVTVELFNTDKDALEWLAKQN